jgi:PAS domain S-box-containing protein
MKTSPDAKHRESAVAHVCSVYREPKEQLSSLIPFLRAGLERGERCIYVAENKHKFAPVLAALKSTGVASAAAVRSGALMLDRKQWAQFQDVRFDLRAILSLLRKQKTNALGAGYTGVRVAIEMDWIMRTGMASENWVGFERRLTYALADIGCMALCQYDLQRCTPSIILGALRAHPLVFSGEMPCENFYFVPPEDRDLSEYAGHEVERRLQNLRERERTVRDLKLFRTLIDRSNDAIEVVDPVTMRFLDVNEKACVELGYSRDELLKLTVFDIDPLATADAAAGIQHELRTVGGSVVETVHRRKDGSTFPVEVNLRRVELDRNYIVSVTRNITDRKQMIAALREREDHYRDLVEHSSDLICTHDLDGRMLSVNEAATRILGYSREEILETPMPLMMPPEWRQQFDDYIAKIRQRGTADGLLAVLTKSGERRIWEYHNSLRTEGVAKPIVRGIAHDVTEQKRAEKALRASEEKFAKAFRASPEMMLIVSLDEGRFIEVNEAFERQLGCSREEIIGHTYRELNLLLNADQRKVLLEQLQGAGCIRNQEFEFCSYFGELRTLLVSTETIELEGRACLVAVGQDITAMKHTERQLREVTSRVMASQDEERRRIARELHDSTAQQLTGIRMNLGTIKRALTNADPKALRAVKECQQLAEQCAREIRTLSYLLHPPLLEEFGLAMALQCYIEGLGKRSELEIHLDVDGALAELRFPRELETSLFRIVQESLNNIIRHSGSATAAVRLKHSDGEIRLQISDHGRGIDAATILAVSSGNSSSIGVGLPGMGERVRQLGGHFNLESSASGTTVFVDLPLNGAYTRIAPQELTSSGLK